MTKNTSRWGRLYLWLIVLIFYIPIILTVVYSFNLSKISSIWSGFSLKWYEELFRDKMLMKALKNSLILAFSSCILSGIIGTLAAMGFFSRKTKMDKLVETFSISPLMLPEIVLATGLMTIFSLFRMKFGMLTLIIAHTTFCVPYVYLMVKSRLENMDKSLEEAALDLGASQFRMFWDIKFPELLPGIISGMLLSFAMSFDDVVVSVLVTGSGVNTLPMLIYSSIKTGVTPKINALITLMLVVIIAVLGLYGLSRYIFRKSYRRFR